MRQHKNGPPRHVAFIMDGNGRWAERMGLPRTAGHVQGALAFEAILKAAPDLGVTEVSAYVFSKENWTREEREVAHIMKLFLEYLRKFMKEAIAKKIRVHVVGDRHDARISHELCEAIVAIEKATHDNHHGLTVNLLFNYGGDDDCFNAGKHMAMYAYRSSTNASHLTSDLFRDFLYSSNVSDVDVLIRTGGEYRLSNMLPWQTRYAELIFRDECWPAYTPQQFAEDIEEYKNRHRTYGGTPKLVAVK